MHFSAALDQLSAAADPSRLRLLAVLATGEAAVAELCAVLEQSQPRISRHLRLLTEAGLIENFKEGRFVFYRLTPEALEGGIGRYLAALTGGDDPDIARDAGRMAALKRQREGDALREAHPELARSRVGAGAGVEPPGQLAEVLREALDLEAEPPDTALGRVLDVGSGSGAVLNILAPYADSAVGIEPSSALRQLARARLHGAPYSRCTFRDGDMHDLPFPAESFDLVVLDEVFPHTDAPDAVLAEAARVLRADGRLLILDRVSPVAAGANAGTLADNELVDLLSTAGLRVARRRWLPGKTPDRAVITARPEAERRP